MKSLFKLLLAVTMLSSIVVSCDKTTLSETESQSEIQYKDDIHIDLNRIINNLCYDPRNIDLISPCFTDYDPVCACETVTFGNGCTAEAFGFQNYTKGSCLEQKCYSEPVKRALYPSLHCPEETNYVCGCNNITYKNDCEALRNGVLVTTPGRCDYGTDINLDSLIEKGCFDPNNIELVSACPMVLAPVCACGVIEFSNGCFARAAGFQNYEQGGCVQNRCKSESVKKFFSNFRFNCNAFGSRVCGCDGEDYDSWCHALVNGVLASYPGPCGNPGGDLGEGTEITIQNP